MSPLHIPVECTTRLEGQVEPDLTSSARKCGRGATGTRSRRKGLFCGRRSRDCKLSTGGLIGKSGPREDGTSLISRPRTVCNRDSLSGRRQDTEHLAALPCSLSAMNWIRGNSVCHKVTPANEKPAVLEARIGELF